MIPARMLRITAIGLMLAGCASGCRSSNGSFQIDSNSHTPWFGLDIPLGMDDSHDKPIELVDQSGTAKAHIAKAQQKSTPAKSEKAPGLISRLLGTEQSIPLPDDASPAVKDRVVVLEGPRETFQ